MSRRNPNPSADRTAQNQQTLKTLLKVESNKSCADCKRNKHPRWASWNLGIFVCIRCSGIHRGMGTHISRVKSVDLDSWTDEQMQSMVNWGNARANKYWEAKLAPGHVPAEAKIENFIRTKYDSKRWVMEGGIPDPATLDTNDGDQTPAEAVPAPPKVERSTTLRAPPVGPASAPLRRPAPSVDLFGDEAIANSPNPVTLVSASAKPPPPPKTEMAASKQTKPADSLLGFDFFGSTQAAPPARPSSAAASHVNANLPSRPDLKQSILSLYASSSRISTPTPAHPAANGGAPVYADPSSFTPPQQPAPADLHDAFGGLSFASTAPPAPPKPTSFNNLASPPPQIYSTIQTNAISSNTPVARGSFFDAKPASNVNPTPIATTRQRGFSSSLGGFGDFSSATSDGWEQPPRTSTGDGSNAPSGIPTTSTQFANVIPSVSTSSNAVNSPFNLSATSNPLPPKTTGNTTSKPVVADPWGSSDIWASSNSAAGATYPPPKANPTIAVSKDAWGWGESGSSHNSARGSTTAPSQPAQITRDEDFGGWESSAPPPSNALVKQSNVAASKPAGGFGGGGEDLFSNVWE